MWVRRFSKIYQGVSQAAVWKIWQDIDNYPAWHDDLDYCRLEGEFKVGNFFWLRPKGGPQFKVHLIDMTTGESFSDCTHFFGAKMYDIHEMQQTESGLQISNTIKVTGVLSFLWIKLVAKNVAASSAKEMDAVVDLARRVDA